MLVPLMVLLVDCEEWICNLVESLPCVRRAISCFLFSLERRQQRTSGRNDEKLRPSHTDVIFVVMDALVNVLVDEVLTFYCHETGDCNAVAPRTSSELSQSAECQSVRPHVMVRTPQVHQIP